MLDRYFEHVKTLVAQTLGDSTVAPRQRVANYLNLISQRLAHDQYARGCLIGDFSIEAGPHSEMLRQRLASIFEEWRVPFAACIAEGQKRGEIPAEFAATELADFILTSWEGAILRMKVDRNPLALERFKKIAFQTVLRATK